MYLYVWLIFWGAAAHWRSWFDEYYAAMVTANITLATDASQLETLHGGGVSVCEREVGTEGNKEWDHRPPQTRQWGGLSGIPLSHTHNLWPHS